MNGSAASQDQISGLIAKGQQLLQARDLAQAEILFQQALQLEPRNVDALHLLGVIAHRSGKFDIAVDLIAKAIEEDPSVPNFHLNLGNVYKEQDRLDQAAACYQGAIQLNPNYAKAYNNLGVVLTDQEQLDQAIACLQHALQIDPGYAEAHLNLGTAFQLQGKLDHAARSFLHAVQLKPDHAEAYVSLGTALKDQGHLATAISCYENALRLNPGYATAHWNRSGALLQTGDLPHGWDDYEWRWKTANSDLRKRDFPQPWWQGEDLGDKTILIWAEQGVGDEILFASMLPDIIARAGHCIVECDARLAPLFARSFPQAKVVPRSNPPHPRTIQPDVHFQVPMGSLARWFRNSLDSFPAHRGYLAPDPQQLANWKNRLADLGSGRKVGICWRSMLRNVVRNGYFTELNQWKPILTAPGVVFVNLQYDHCQPELDAAEQQFGVKIHAWDDIDLKNDLDEAAALTAALDLVISAPTSVAAMAGALGVPVWELASKEGNWSTMGTDHMPWYPSMRLFSRAWNENWGGIIEAISCELRGMN